jgi:putative transcriptional regulator
MRFVLAALLLALGLPAGAQQAERPNSLLLVAKPGLPDPNFARTVVLVTQTGDASTVGVILNRPTQLKLGDFLSREYPAENYRDAIYVGGPVMRQVLVALFQSDEAPKAAAFHVLKGVYLTMHADNLRTLLADPKARYRLYSGFSGWAPRQLESEFMREGWYVLPADATTLFRETTDGLWEELLDKAMRRGPRTLGEIGPMASNCEALQ